MPLEYLFTMELQYKGRIELAPLAQTEGRLVGGGEGAVEGPRIKGTVRWSNYERSIAEGICLLDVPAVIETQDGAQIRFLGRGHALASDKALSNKWSVTAALRFQTDDERYQWLNSVLAVWEGEFDMVTGRAHHHVYGHIKMRDWGQGSSKPARPRLPTAFEPR